MNYPLVESRTAAVAVGARCEQCQTVVEWTSVDVPISRVWGVQKWKAIGKPAGIHRGCGGQLFATKLASSSS